ncbi:ABC transporter ATP-binding protein [Dethiobacter alkaliphilus]|uniref:ABC transporter related protein n=1 Tax=Dethiobacter alkaliphilus AHT 1 TaxID=555088 RepID=C0GFS7_DETAL|nr:ATP-binding cassette domain-containing protein [Dethiobacter alkaliphilus]EEG77616.1 ABC transporter related protein [Dethiobacter alkaliphilus AHT 1]
MLLEAKNIGFRYGEGPWVLRGVSLSLKPGEVVGLSGHSGCGKTTLARVLAGYEPPLEGSVTLDGKPLPKKGYNPVQLVFQHPEKAVNDRWRMEYTLRENRWYQQKVLTPLGIEPDWLTRWPKELSGGELQRFCVARALGPQTRFLIADEMTTMLDAITQAQIWHVVLDAVKEQNLGVLVVSHEQTLLERLCSRVIDLEAFRDHSTKHHHPSDVCCQ